MFTSIEFKEAWENWKSHKKEKTSFPYTKTAEQMALSALFKKSHGIEDLAIASITYSMEKNWSDIYIKPKENEQPQGSASSNIRSSVQEEFNKRFAGRG